MMPAMTSTTDADASKRKELAVLKRQFDRYWNAPGWKKFRQVRKDNWDPLIRRQSPQTLNPEAAQFLQATNTIVDIQSPDLEQDLHDRKAIMMKNGARIDAISLDPGTVARGVVEEIRMYSAGSWLAQDDGGEIRGHIYEQMARWGVALLEKTYDEPQEPSDDVLPQGSPKAALAARDKYHRETKHQAFGWRPSSPMQMVWWPLRKPNIFIGEETIHYEDARDLTNDEGKPFRIDRNSHVYFFDEGTPSDEVTEDQWGDKSVNVITRAMPNKKTGRWQITRWVRNANAPVEESTLLETVECPFKRAPFFVAPGGDELVTENDPHLRYRPMLYSLIVDVQELNALVTLLVMTAVWHIQNPFYVRYDRLDQNQIAAVEGMAQAGFGVIEGAGAERAFLFRMPDAGSGELGAYPALEAMPNANLPEAFVARIQQVQTNIERHKSNRYLTGDATDVTTQQPSTTTLNQAEAASTPFGPYLNNCATLIKDWLVAEHEAIAYWGAGMKGKAEMPFPMRIRGDEPVISDSREAGDEVVLTATKVTENPYVLTVIIRGETQAERAMNEQLADIAYEKGADTKQQWLRKRGYDDPQKQEELLWEDAIDRAAEERYMQVFMDDVNTLFTALSGLSPSLMQTVGADPAMGGGAPSAPSQQSPTGSQTERPGFGVHNGTAPVVNSAEGRSAGAGGVM